MAHSHDVSYYRAERAIAENHLERLRAWLDEQEKTISKLSKENAAFQRTEFRRECNELCSFAAAKGNRIAIELLLEKGAEAMGIEGDSTSPFYEAAKKGDIEILQMLAPKGDVNREYQDGWTALHAAASRGHVAAIEVLIKSGALVNKENRKNRWAFGWTPLHSAACENRAEAIQILLKKGALIHKTSSSGDTALHVAAHYGCKSAIEALIEKDADINRNTSLGKTIPLDVALESDQGEIANYLSLLGGKRGVEMVKTESKSQN